MYKFKILVIKGVLKGEGSTPPPPPPKFSNLFLKSEAKKYRE